MIIRAKQIGTLTGSVAFEEEMNRHLHEFSPLHCKVMKDDEVLEVIRRGIRSAAKYEFTNRGPVRLYLELTFMFGSYFDTDPLLGWAGEILRSGGPADQMERAERLYTKALEYTKATAGPNHEHAKAAFKRARSVRYEDLARPAGDFEAACLGWLRAGYPQKFDYVGAPAVSQMVHEAVGKAQELSIGSEAGTFLIVAMMFAVGHGFPDDPLYPWISRTLKNDAISDPNRRAERVYSKTMTYLDRVLANLS